MDEIIVISNTSGWVPKRLNRQIIKRHTEKIKLAINQEIIRNNWWTRDSHALQMLA